MTPKQHKEYLKLMPFLWLLTSLIMGVALGWWIFLFSPFLYYKNVRIYVALALFGAVLNQTLHKETTSLEPNKFYDVTCVVNSQLQKKLYEVTVLSSSSDSSSVKNQGGFSAALEMYQDYTHIINEHDTLKLHVYLETLARTKRDKSTANNLINIGLSQILINDPDTDIEISRFRLSGSNIATTRLIIKNRLSELLKYSKNALILDQIIIGDRNPASKKQAALFRKAGIAHVLAISGLHIGILFVIISSLLFFMDYVFELKIAKFVLTSALIFGYVWFINFHPSAVRAAIMFSLLSFSSFMATSTATRYNILFGTAFMMILFNTTLIYNLSFQLSFIAVGAIMYSLAKFKRVLKAQNKVVRYLMLSVIITLSAQLATLPLTVYYFGEISTISLVTNLIISPLIAPLIVLALLYIATGADFIGQLTIFILDLIVDIADLLTKIPYTYFQEIDLRQGEMWLIYVAYALFLIYIELTNRYKTLSLR